MTTTPAQEPADAPGAARDALCDLSALAGPATRLPAVHAAAIRRARAVQLALAYRTRRAAQAAATDTRARALILAGQAERRLVGAAR